MLVRLPLVSMYRPLPEAAIAFVSATISRSSARREGIGMPPQPLCGSFVDEAMAYDGRLRLVPNHPETRDYVEYERQAREVREDHHLGPEEPILFLEVYIDDPSEFHDEIEVCGAEIDGYRVLRAQGAAIPNTIAAIMMHLRDISGRRPHAYFNWTEGSPFTWILRFLISGTGEIAPITREILRKAERDPAKRPSVHAAM